MKDGSQVSDDKRCMSKVVYCCTYQNNNNGLRAEQGRAAIAYLNERSDEKIHEEEKRRCTAPSNKFQYFPLFLIGVNNLPR